MYSMQLRRPLGKRDEPTRCETSQCDSANMQSERVGIGDEEDEGRADNTEEDEQCNSTRKQNDAIQNSGY